jgi:hypothetical protein
MTYQDLKNKLDRLFSAYIRMRDKDKPCISCGKNTNDKEAGHFYPRSNLAVRWDEMNVHGQCLKCNRYNGGNRSAFGRGVAIRYGESVVEALDIKSQARIKLKSYELMEKIDHYQNKLKNFN